MHAVSQFYGIIISMYHKEPGTPHFRARYGEQRAVFSLGDSQQTEGQLPKRAEQLVMEWAVAHRQELMENWALAQANQPLRQIASLE
jgi:hypothetical protein